MKRRTLLVFLTFVAIATCLLAWNGTAKAAGGAPPKPELIRIASYKVGTSTYAIVGAWGEGINKKFGIKIRLFPHGATVGRILAVKKGASDVVTLSADAMYMMEGLYDYGTLDWGPQQVRLVYQGRQYHPFTMVTTRVSGIKTFADLKGKRVAYVVGSPGANKDTEGFLAWARLTWDDVIPVRVKSLRAVRTGLLDGTIDAGMCPSLASDSFKLAESPRGIYYIPMPPEDKEAWERFHEHSPYKFPAMCTLGAGLSEDNPQPLVNHAFPLVTAFKDLEESKAYWLTKGIAESYDLYKDLAKQMKGSKLENGLAMPMHLPWHEGTVKYFKEIGVWTDRFERNQQSLLERQAKLNKLRADVVAEAREKGIGKEDFADFWMKRRAKIFPGFHKPLD